MTKTFLSTLALLLFSLAASAQPDRWQQAVDYQMEIDMDVNTHRYDGQQTLQYTNNSPDTLHHVFYHLYFNAFQPGSMMDVRNLILTDADRRVGERITNLKPDEIGYIKVNSLTQDGRPVQHETVGTILEVELDQPIFPGQTTTFAMNWQAQVPVQIRRSGRDNAEGIDYSMAQWYPKMAEYDYQGWHANPYVGREFYSVWGDFDVKINIDSDYVVAATGYLQNPSEIGYGYAPEPARRPNTLTYHFKAPNVGDFVWAADPDYKHTRLARPDGLTLNFFYQPGEATNTNWENLPPVMDEAFNFINQHFGQYPYKQYSFIQGGDGGMEYPMATLITGERNFPSLVGVSVHELMHSWYQAMMGTNESLYPWMDEGFTSWASAEVINHLKKKGLLGSAEPVNNSHAGTYQNLRGFRQSGLQEALSTHADHYSTNAAYGVGSYVNGAVFLEQLRFIIGEDAFRRTMLRYYDTWRFKHPNANDFIRIAEKESQLELDWYLEYWVNGVDYADYAVKNVSSTGTSTTVELEKVGRMPMPIEVLVTKKDGSEDWYYIAPRILRGEKVQPSYASTWTVVEDWPWTHPTYKIKLPYAMNEVRSVQIDPRGRMYEDDVENNSWEQ